MSTPSPVSLSPDTLEMLESLRQTAARTLEQKRRLGHYAVVWKDGRPVAVGDDAPEDLHSGITSDS